MHIIQRFMLSLLMVALPLSLMALNPDDKPSKKASKASRKAEEQQLQITQHTIDSLLEVNAGLQQRLTLAEERLTLYKGVEHQLMTEARSQFPALAAGSFTAMPLADIQAALERCAWFPDSLAAEQQMLQRAMAGYHCYTDAVAYCRDSLYLPSVANQLAAQLQSRIESAVDTPQQQGQLKEAAAQLETYQEAIEEYQWIIEKLRKDMRLQTHIEDQSTELAADRIREIMDDGGVANSRSVIDQVPFAKAHFEAYLQALLDNPLTVPEAEKQILSITLK